MKKKIIIITISSILVILLLVFALPNKKNDINQEEPGGFSDVDIENPDPVNTNEKIESTIKEPFGFSYKLLELPRSNQRFAVPNDFEISFVNAKHIVIESPKDGKFGGIQFHLLLNCPVEPDIPDASIVNGPHKHVNYFLDQISCSEFKFNGETYLPNLPVQIDDIYIEQGIIEGDIAISYGDRPGVFEKYDGYELKNHSFVSAAYTRGRMYCLWETVCPPEKKEDAIKLMCYIISTVSDCKPVSCQYKDVKLDNFSLSIPSVCQEHTYNGNTIYVAPYNNAATYYSGLGFGVFNYDFCKSQDFQNVIKAFTGNTEDDESKAKITGHYSNIDFNGNITQDCDYYGVSIYTRRGDLFYSYGDYAGFWAMQYGDKVFIIWDKCDLFNSHYEEFYNNCLVKNFRVN